MDWREKLKSTVDEYVEEKSRITKALQEVLSELKVEPYGIHSNSELVGLSPLEWKVTVNLVNVGRVILSITIDDIKEVRISEDNAGYPLTEDVIPEDIHQVLRNVITRKIVEHLAI
ncbi:hypothetical protein [Paenibacillus motobuensis]|uniref:Uncharacterized protein n=1 Tax=Paenibacillus motobuensis TaxID=295324 RepID=A0ABP3I4H1_9BACL